MVIKVDKLLKIWYNLYQSMGVGCMNEKKIIFRHILSIIFVLTFLGLSTLFIFLPRQEEMAGALSYLGRMNALTFIPITDDLSLEYAYPISDYEGKNIEAYQFEVMNKGSENHFQLIFLTGEGEDCLPQKAIHYVIADENGEYSEVRTLADDGIIVDDVIGTQDTKSYSLKFWIHDENDDSIFGTTFEAILELKAVK